MSDLIKGFQSGEEQKKNWFQETKENLLTQVSEKPLKFVFWSMVLGIGSMYAVGYILSDLETANVVHMPGMKGNDIDLGHWSNGYEWHSPYRN